MMLSTLEETDWPIESLRLYGADGENEGEEDDDENPEGDSENDSADEEETGEEEKVDAEGMKAKIAAQAAEIQRHRNRRMKAEAALAKALEGSESGSSEGNTDETSKKLEADVASLRDTNTSLALENAFLKVNKYRWHNAEAAMALTDFSDIEIDEDGKVHGLEEALAETAAKHEYLIQSEDKGSPKKSGDSPKGKKTPAAEKATRAKVLKDKYPGLRGR